MSWDFLKKYCKYIILSLFVLGGFLISWVSTLNGGINLSPDSANYLCAARTFAQGRGFLCYDNTYFVKWPPLYPFILSIFIISGWDMFYSLPVFQSLLFAGIVLFSGLLLIRKNYPLVLIFLGLFFFCFSIPFHYVTIWMWTEPLFLFLLIIFFYLFDKFMDSPGYKYLILSAVVCSLVWLTKYTGGVGAITGLIFILTLGKLNLSRRIKMSLTFLFLAAFPLGVWLGRNYILTHTLTGIRFPSRLTLAENIYRCWDVITAWFFSFFLPLKLRTVLFIVPFTGVVYFGFKNKRTKFMLTFAGGYLLFLIFMATWIHFDKLDTRLLSPVYLPLIFIILEGLNLLSRHQHKPPKSIAGYLLVFWFLVSVFCGYRVISVGYHFYTTGSKFPLRRWQSMEVMRWLKKHPLQGVIYSNAPDIIYLGGGLNARIVPERCQGWQEMELALTKGGNVYLVWFGIHKEQNIFSLEEIARRFHLTMVKKFPRAVVFKVDEKN